MSRRGSVVAVAAVAAIGVLGAGILWLPRQGETAGPSAPAASPGVAPVARTEPEVRAEALAPPGVSPARISCENLQRIMAQVLGELVEEPAPVEALALAVGVRDWLDPHGFWSAAPDSSAGKRIAQTSWIAAIHRAGEPCEEARAIGALLEREIGDLGAEFDEARAGEGPRDPQEEPWLAASTTAFESTRVTRDGIHTAHILGRRVGAVERALGAEFSALADEGRRRFFPSLHGGEWAEAVHAALLRSWVVLVDPHGDWAPNGEEASVLELDLEGGTPSPFWVHYARTALGLRIDEGAEGGFRDGDVVISMDDHATMGLSPEQIEQLRWHLAYTHKPFAARVLRPEPLRVETLRIDLASPVASEFPADEYLHTTVIPYGDGGVYVVAIPDVRTNLGDELGAVLTSARLHKAIGIVLDLRGNGGGATEGAGGALAHFLPKAPLFALRRRDGTLEVQQAGDGTPEAAWKGPAAVLVDGATASAAEMIGGALSAYGRAPLVGAQTFGKGCAQEYLDDAAEAGVLRITTLVYALPDGSPVQRIGLKPRILIDEWQKNSSERERDLRGAPKSWQGPDVRDRRLMADLAGVHWPSHLGRVGPCAEPSICRALKLLGTQTSARR